MDDASVAGGGGEFLFDLGEAFFGFGNAEFEGFEFALFFEGKFRGIGGWPLAVGGRRASTPVATAPGSEFVDP